MSCIGDFLYFCMRCLAFISLPMRRGSVCGFLHEANVAVDFSFSSLSLCDIVYWEKNNKTNVNKKFLFYFLFQKRILWYGLLLPFVMILMKNFCVSFVKMLFLSSHTDSWKALPFILYFPFFLWRLQKGMFMWHMQKLPSPWWCEELCWGSPRGTVIHTTQEIPLDQSINASCPHA